MSNLSCTCALDLQLLGSLWQAPQRTEESEQDPTYPADPLHLIFERSPLPNDVVCYLCEFVDECFGGSSREDHRNDSIVLTALPF